MKSKERIINEIKRILISTGYEFIAERDDHLIFTDREGTDVFLFFSVVKIKVAAISLALELLIQAQNDLGNHIAYLYAEKLNLFPEADRDELAVKYQQAKEKWYRLDKDSMVDMPCNCDHISCIIFGDHYMLARHEINVFGKDY